MMENFIIGAACLALGGLIGFVVGRNADDFDDDDDDEFVDDIDDDTEN